MPAASPRLCPSVSLMLLALVLLTCAPAAKAEVMDLTEGFGGVRYGALCSEAFAGKEWRLPGIYPIWNETTRELRLSYDPVHDNTARYKLWTFKDQKLDTDDLSLLNVFYACDKETDKFVAVVATFSILQGGVLQERLRARFGEPTVMEPQFILWETPEFKAQLNLNEVILFAAGVAGE